MFVKRTLLLALTAVLVGQAHATPNLLTVCDTGCSHTSLQSAIDAVTSSSITSPWTIRVEPQALSITSPVLVQDKHYLTITGAGDGASVLQATSAWFSNAASDPTKENFFTIKGSDHIQIRDLTLDAATNAPSNVAFDGTPAGLTTVLIDSSGQLRFEDVGILGTKWGMKDLNMETTDRVDLFGCRLESQYITLWPSGGVWNVWNSDVRAEGTLTANAPPVYALALYATNNAKLNAWGTHFHGESVGGYAYTQVGGLLEDSGGSGTVKLSFTGCTLHAKLTGPELPTQLGSLTAARVKGGGGVRVQFTGSELIYEAPPVMTVGTVAAIQQSSVFVAPGQPWQAAVIDIVGTAVVDRARDDTTTPPVVAGATHADLVRAFGGTAPPNFARYVGSSIRSLAGGNSTSTGSAMQTMETQSGTTTLAAGTATVTLPRTAPSATYQVVLSSGANETLYVSARTATTFTVSSSVANSTAKVDWVVRY